MAKRVIVNGRVSWFGGSNDSMDSGRTASGGTTATPGVAIRPGAHYESGRATLGGYWRITDPKTGKSVVLKQTDIGPNQSTGRRIDVTYSALKKFGYSERNFPTDANWQAEYLGKNPGSTSPGARTPTSPASAPAGGSDLQAQARRQAAAQWLLSSSKSVADLQNRVAQAEASVPASTQQPTTVRSTRQRQPTARPASGHGPGDLKELFWQGQGGINVKDGRHVPQGFVSGHQDHVHVASGPRQVLRIARKAQQMGLRVGENPAYGGVAPVHAQNSYHYRNQAIDVSGDPVKMRRFAAWVARTYGVKV